MWICLFVYLWFVAAYKEIECKLTSGGLKGRSQFIDLLSLSLNDYVYRQAHPSLRRLQLNLALFISQHLQEFLNPQVSVYYVFLTRQILIYGGGSVDPQD
jgi:hypothetical protein